MLYFFHDYLFINNVMSGSYITSHVMDLTQSKQFYIITHLKVDFSLIIRHLIHLIFLLNFCNQPS